MATKELDFMDTESIKKLEENKKRAAKLCAMINRSIEVGNSEAIGLDKKLEFGQMYFESRQPQKGVRFNEYRDKTAYRTCVTYQSLLCANDPKYSFMPVEPLDSSLVNVFRKVDNYCWEQMDLSLNYKFAVLDALKFGTGCLWFSKGDVWEDTEILTPLIGEVVVSNWTEFKVKYQQWVARLVIMPKEEIEENWPDLEDINPTVESSVLTLMNNVVKSFWTYISGDVNKTFDGIKKHWSEGNGMVWELFYYAIGRKNIHGTTMIKRAYIVNGQLAEDEDTDYPVFPLIALRNRPQNKRFLGIAEVELSKDISDVKTSMVQSMLYHDALYGKPTVIFDDMCGFDGPDIQGFLSKPGSAIPIPHEVFAQGGGINFLQPQPLPGSKLQLFEYADKLADDDTGRSKWLEGTVASGSDPASKVAYLQQAGLTRIKMQAKFFDQDALHQLGILMLWHIQTLDVKKIIRINGEKTSDGRDKFITLNLDIPKDEIDAAAEEARLAIEAQENGVVMIRGQEFDPYELLMMIEMYHERVDKDGSAEVVKLHDLKSVKMDVSIGDSDALPFNQTEKKQVMGFGLQAGVIRPVEWREEYGQDTSDAVMNELPAVMAVKSQKMQMAQAESQMAAQQQMQEQQMIQAQMQEQMPPEQQQAPQEQALIAPGTQQEQVMAQQQGPINQYGG